MGTHARTSGIEVRETDGREPEIRVLEQMDASTAAALWTELVTTIDRLDAGRIRLDLSEVPSIDSAGVALIRGVERRCGDAGQTLDVQGATGTVAAFLERFHEETDASPPTPLRPGPIVAMGEWGIERARQGIDLVGFLGRVVLAIPLALARRRPVPSLDQFLFQVERAGADAMSLVIGLSLLMGIITALNFIRGLEDFNATSFLAGVVSVSLTRELGPLLTGIVLAGRSGAGLAAELGTMKAGEELDALEAMGFDVLCYLVLPRLGALLIAGPLLTALANLSGLIGGAFIGKVNLDLSPVSFFIEAREALTLGDLGIGFVKGLAFAAVVGTVGCFKGLQSTRAAESVGVQTTSAVVTSILLILVVDAGLTAVLQMHGW